MRERVLRDWLIGEVPTSELLRDLEGTVEQLSPAGVIPVRTRYHVMPMGEEFGLTAAHVTRVIDALLTGQIDLLTLEPISFCLEMSDNLRCEDNAEGDRALDVVSWLANPNINYAITPSVLNKMKHYLATGENALTPGELAMPEARDPHTGGVQTGDQSGVIRRQEVSPTTRSELPPSDAAR